MRIASNRSTAIACAAALCALLAACGGGGGGGDDSGGGGNGLTPFPTEKTDELPPGTRIDVSSKNLFQMGAGDIWYYTVLDAGGNPTFAFASRQVTSDDGAGHVTLVDNDGGSSTTNYTVSADGLLDPHPLGAAPATMAGIVGGIFEYATPLYPVGAVRRHVRSGPWGEDLDGDGVGESFRFEFTQTFLGFESAQLSGFVTLADVAHFHNVIQITLRPTDTGNTDYSITVTEDDWFAPGLGLVKSQRTAVDSDGFTVDPPHTLLFKQGNVAGVNWDVTVPPPPPLDGSFIDVALVHNALVYDSLRNVYYASIPGSVIGKGNSIATIDPVTGQVAYSAPVGSEPDALAIAADASVLYVGLDGSGDVVKLSLPEMAEQARTKLVSDGFFGQSHAETIAVSPADSTVVAVSMAWSGVSPRHAGAALLRNMVMQPQRTQVHTGSNLVTFDSAGTSVYGLNNETTEFGLRHIQVLADGLVQDLVVGAATSFATRALSFSSNRVIAGNALYDATLNALGVISGASDCIPRRADAPLVCLAIADFGSGQARMLLADPATSVIGSSLLFARSEPSSSSRRMVEGPAGQVAISYAPSTVRLFSSAQLLTPPAPPVAAWPVTAFTTADGQGLDVGILHNALVYDSAHNLYYASVPGSVIGSGNSIARIDPATGQVTHSAPVGSEPTMLAISADANALYVGLDGSGEVVRLALPSMTEQGRLRLPSDPFFGHSVARALAVSPADPAVAAVTMGLTMGVGLLRNMVLQPKRASQSAYYGNNLLAFDAAGAALYGLNNETSDFPLRRFQVLADGLVQDLVVGAATSFATRALSFSNNRVIAGGVLYDAPALTAAGVISGASDCVPQRAGSLLLCLAVQTFSPGQGRILLADSGNFVIGASLLFAANEPYPANRRLAQGPAGQVAISYTNSYFNPPLVRLFSSVHLP